jgi:hypothetical protein
LGLIWLDPARQHNGSSVARGRQGRGSSAAGGRLDGYFLRGKAGSFYQKI